MGCKSSGKLDTPTRQALLQQNRTSTITVKLAADDVSGPFVYPFPKKPEDQAKLKFLGYRNMLEKVAERYHTTPDTVVALNGPDKLIGPGQTLRLPNVSPRSRDYGGTINDKQKQLLNMLNVDGNEPQGDFIVVDKSDGTLKVYKKGANDAASDADASKADKNAKGKGSSPSVPPGTLVAQFPVTTGSSHDPLPLGTWKATTYSFLPPFNYQPDLFWDVADDKAEQKLAAGPNGPVGVAWLDLTKEHYGIHGTHEPQTIEHTESHGCLRLTNWDVMRLSRMMKPGFTALISWLRRQELRIAATALFTAVFTAVLVSAFWIWFYNFVPSKPADRRAQRQRRDGQARARRRRSTSRSRSWSGPSGLAHPGRRE